MIEKVYGLSKVILEHGTELPDYMRMVQSPASEEGIVIKVDLDEEKYTGITPFKYVPELLFVSQKGQERGKSPTLNLVFSSQEKKDQDKLEGKIEKVLQRIKSFFDDNRLRDIHQILVKNKAAIKDDIVNYAKHTGYKNLFVSVIVKKEGRELKPADMEKVIEVFKERKIEGVDKTGKSKAKKGICFFCGRVANVAPRVSEVFKFATFDKPGFTVGLSKNAEDILNICEDCFVKLMEIRNYINETLSASFFGDTLWIIPSGLKEEAKKFLDEIKDFTIENTKEEKSVRKNFAKLERTFEEFLAERSSVTYDFLILSISNNEEKILLHITEVSPTRIRKMIKISNALKQDLGERYDPTLENYRVVFNPPKSRNSGKTAFYKLVKAIYSGSPFSKEVFLGYLMRWIRSRVLSDGTMKSLVFHGRMGFSLLVFLMRLGVIQGGVSMKDSTCNERSYFESYRDFFDADWKKAVFMLGVLTGILMEHQEEERGKSPFLKKLRGLKMNKNEVLALLPELKLKFVQYGVEDERIKKLMEQTSRWIVSAGNWNASIDEINMIFTVGISLHNKFYRRDENEKE